MKSDELEIARDYLVGVFPLRFETGAVVFWTVLLVGFGVVSSLVSARRVLRIDPIAATTGAGVSA